MVQDRWKNELAAYLPWSDQWVQPVIKALFREDYALTQELLDRAEAALPESGLAPDVQEALSYALLLFTYRLRWQSDQALWTAASYQEALQVFSKPAHTAFGDRERIMRRFVIMMHAEKQGFTAIEREELERLLAWSEGDPESNVLAHYIGDWAFRHRDLPLLEHAFAEHLLNPSRMLGQAKWQRINLMYQLLSGKATRRDIEESIKLLRIKPQLIEFLQNFWPACQETGLVDQELKQLLDRRSAEINSASLDDQQLLEPKTKSARG